MLTLSLDLVSSSLGPFLWNLSQEHIGILNRSLSHQQHRSGAALETTRFSAFCFLLSFSLFKPTHFFSFLVLFKCSTSLFLVSLGFVFPFFFLLYTSLTLLLLLTTRGVHSIYHILFGPVRLLFLSLSLCPCAPSLSCLIVNLINRTFSRSHLLFLLFSSSARGLTLSITFL